MKPFEDENQRLKEEIEAEKNALLKLTDKIMAAKQELQLTRDDSSILFAFITQEAYKWSWIYGDPELNIFNSMYSKN